MEAGLEKNERTAPMALDIYLASIFDFDQIDGRVPVNDTHAFYIWLSRQDKYKNIDGYSILELYETNVADGEMDAHRFIDWCKDFDLPYPIDEKNVVTQLGKEFSLFLNKEREDRNRKYEVWAAENGIDFQEGAVMKFIDTEGNIYRVHTDANNRGEIIA